MEPATNPNMSSTPHHGVSDIEARLSALEAENAALREKIAAHRPETQAERLAREEKEFQYERQRTALVSTVSSKAERVVYLDKLASNFAPFHALLLDVARDVEKEQKDVREQLEDATKNLQNVRRKTLEEQLENLDTVLEAIYTGRWRDSGDLEDRLRAKGLRPLDGRSGLLDGRKSLKRTYDALIAVREERARAQAELDAARADLAVLEAAQDKRD